MGEQPSVLDRIGDLRFLPVSERLFDTLSDVVFFVKDTAARYAAVNRTLVQRCGLASKDELLGKTALEIFPASMGESYYEEDRQVLEQGASLRDLLQLHLYIQGSPGWCVTTKLPLQDEDGAIVGIVGISSDIRSPATEDRGYGELAEAVRHIQAHFDQPLRLEALGSMCGLSIYQFEQRMKKVFQITAGQFISKTRIDAACLMLKSDRRPISEIALNCGFSDQSAFTRQFKATTGITPAEYRKS